MIIGLALVLTQAASVLPTAPDAFASFRAIIAPSLNCERKFDAQRRKLLDEDRAISKMPIQNLEDDRIWREAYSLFQERDRQFRKARALSCKPETSFDLLKARLAAIQPKLTAVEIQAFALGFYNELRQTSEIASDFSAGYDARQYTAPSAPPPPK
jgi:hypothetical protein